MNVVREEHQTTLSLKRFLSVAVALLITLVPLAFHAQAQIDCNSILVDGGNFFGSQASRVLDAADKLTRIGAEVRIRTMRQIAPAANLDDYEARLEAQCASWRAPGGGRKNNLLVFMIYAASEDDRGTGIYYGSQWTTPLDRSSAYLRIQTEFMNPRFRDGDFVGGFVAGINETYRLLDLYLNPPTSSPSPTTTPSTSQPQSGSSGLGNVLIYIVTLIAFLIVVAWVFNYVRRKQIEHAEQLAAQNEAVAERQRVIEAIMELTDRSQGASSLDMLEARIQALLRKIAAADGEPLREKIKTLQQNVAALQGSVADMATSASDPTQPGLSRQTYQAIRSRYSEIYQKLQIAREESAKLKSDVEEMKKIVEQAPEKLSDAQAKLADVDGAISETLQQGFKTTELVQWKDQIAELLGDAKHSIETNSFARAAKLADGALSEIEQLILFAKDLPNIRNQVVEGIELLSKRLTETKCIVSKGRVAFDEIEANYAPAAIQPVRGNGSESEKRILFVEEVQERAKKLTSKDEQRWRETAGLMTESNLALDEVESMMRSIQALREKLQEARAMAPQEIELALADLKKAEAFIQQYDPDIDEALEVDLANAAGLLNNAQQMLTETRPDVVAVVEKARQVNATADQILNMAQDQHERVERLRRRYDAALASARRAISAAQEYIEDYRRRVESSTIGVLNEAITYLNKSKQEETLEKAIEFATKAEAYANEAYRDALDDVDNERRRGRRGGGGSIFIFGSGGSHSSSSGGSSGSSGGGLHFGGGGGGGGGGSSSWGGGGRGGGGSSKW